MRLKPKYSRFLTGTTKVIFIVVVLVLTVRAVLPEVVKYTINNFLGSKMENYTGSVEDVDLAIIRGAYAVEGLIISKKETNSVPFIQIDKVGMGIAWKPLFKGDLLANVVINEPRINFIDSKEPARKQTGKDEKSWRVVIDKLIPINIESIKINDGVVRLLNYDLKVPAEVSVDKLNVVATNVSNKQKDDKALPSKLVATGLLQSDSKFDLRGGFNILEKKPSFDLNFQIRDFELKKLNSILLAYGPVSFTKGKVSVYSEAASKDGEILAYVKPFMEDVDVVHFKETMKNFKHLGFEILGATGTAIFENDETEKSATYVELRGALKKPNVVLDSTLKTSLKNAFGKPIAEGLENTIDITKLE